MAQVLASSAMAGVSSALSSLRTASAATSRAQPQLTVMRTGQSMGGNRFSEQQQRRAAAARSRASACRPKGFYGAPGMGFNRFTGSFGPSDLQDMMEELEKWTGPGARSARRGSEDNPLTFPVDIEETAEAYTFLADLPGVSRSDTKVQANKEDRRLTIRGVRAPPTLSEDQEGRRRRGERRFGNFKRRFTLPDDADLSGISARFKDGVLEVTVKRVQPMEPEVNDVPIDDWIEVDATSSTAAAPPPSETSGFDDAEDPDDYA